MAEAAITPMIGSWHCDNSRTTGFEDFLKEMGVNFVIRKIASQASPKMAVSIEDGKVVFKTDAGFRTQVNSLPLDGSVVRQEQMGGGDSDLHLEIDGDKVITVGIPHDPKFGKVVVTRTIVNGELVQVIDVRDGKVVCTRYFKKV